MCRLPGPGEHGKNGARHAKRIDTRRPRAGLLRGRHHADSHWLYVLDWRGRKVLSRQFPADAAGYEALAGAIAAAGEPACIAMEGTSSYGAGLNPGRLRSEASFAAICGACPIPASSGKTVRHRLNRGGDRQANSALHEIARQRVMRDPETAEYAERARGRGKSDREVMRCLKRYVAREAYRALMRPHEIRRPEDASELVAARRAAKVSQVRAASILGTSEKYISMLERGQRELKPIRRAYEAWVEAGLPLDWDRQAFEAERKMDSKKHLAK